MKAKDRLRRTGGGIRPAAAAGVWSSLPAWSSPIRRSVAVFGLLCSVLCLSPGCGPNEQARAYARAEQAEQRFTVETAPAVIADYRRVIALDPDSDWARKAGARIQALEARVRAEETRRDVFQEHGVD